MRRSTRSTAITHVMRRSRIAVALMSIIVGACESSATKTGAKNGNVVNQSAIDSKRLDSTAVAALHLDSLSEIELGADSTQFPVKVSSMHVTGNRVAIIDKVGRAVRMYDRSGRHLFSMATNRRAADQLLKPEVLRIHGDSLFVMDMNQKRGVAVVSPTGQVARVISLPPNTSMSGLDIGDSIVAAASMLPDSDFELPGARLVTVSTTSGHPIARVCEPDPLYATSLKRNGFFSLFRAFGVRKFGNRIYCMQPISPSIQVFDLAGDSVGTIDVVPPFYRRGKDAPQSMNQLSINEFTSTFTENVDFFPFEHGFVSVYTHFDRATSRRFFELFRCVLQNDNQYRCGMTQSALRPFTVIGGDTVATIIYGTRADSPPHLRLSKLR